MQTLIEVILPVFLVISFGYIAVWRGFFPAAGVDGVLRFAQGFAVPCLLFQAISKLDLGSTFDLRLLLSFYTGATICFFLGMLGARFLFKRDWEDCVAIGFCCLFSNAVLLGLPISERAFGTDNISGNFMIIAMHSPFCYGLGITVMEFTRNRGQSGAKLAKSVARAMFNNPLVIAISAGFAVNLSGIVVPSALNDAISLVVQAALPAALFALGGVLIQYKPEGDLKAIAMVCIIGLMIHPAIVWMMGTTLSVPTDLFRSGVLTAAMAPGFNAYIFANMYGRACRVAASSVLIATVASIFTVWIWLMILG